MNRRHCLLRPIVLAVSSCFSIAPSWANPTGPQVVSGSAQFQGLGTANLKVTNSPSAIINWQGFSIPGGNITQFVQQSSSSAVLNRVVGADISQIQGQLLSNGRVFLINPAGIVIGAGALIDTAGFVGSTLNMLDGDFLAGKLRFQGDASSGSIVNQGLIKTSYGGDVVLIAPQIENGTSGVIQTPGGELILAAGQKATIGSLQHEGVQFEIQAPTDSVVNIGKLLAAGGAVGVFAGTLKHSGEVRADALVRDEGGRVVLKAQGDVTLMAGSMTTASGKTGGGVLVQSTSGQALVTGTVQATGSEGAGGDIKVLGDRVGVGLNALLDASGTAGGGQILVGGDYQGANAAVQNATSTFVSENAELRANATEGGDGGRIIVWSDKQTEFYGNLNARGGPQSGNGGFAEVSGKENLIFAGRADLGAPNGRLGELLLDPLDTYVANGGALLTGKRTLPDGTQVTVYFPGIMDEPTDFPAHAITIAPATLNQIVGNVTLYAGRYMRINDPIALTTAGQSFTAQVGTYTPADPAFAGTFSNQLDVAADITTANGAVNLSAPRIQGFGVQTIATGGGAVTLSSSSGPISGLSINASAAAGAGGAVNVTPATSLQLGTVMGGSFTATAPSFISTGVITTSGGAVTLNSTGSSISATSITTNGGAVALTAPTAGIGTGAITTGSAPVTIAATNIGTGAIDTTAGVSLTASAGSINTTVNNAASLDATATSTFSNAITVNSTTALNATNIVANSSACSFSCLSTVTLNATGDINVGTVRATGFSVNGSLPDRIFVTSSGGSIRGTSSASLVSAADVSLATGLLSGGGIHGTATLNVDVKRQFTLQPNGPFDVTLVGTGPNGLTVRPGVAPAGQIYAGTLTKAGSIALSVNASPTAVTVNNFAVTGGFNDSVFNATPFITLNVPNGDLVVTAMTVPEGDTRPSTMSPPFTSSPLPVSVSSSGNLTVNNYTRQSTASSLSKSTGFSSTGGAVTLGTVDASKDVVSVSAATNVAISNLRTAGAVSVAAGNTFGGTGNVTIGQIDTTSGSGAVTLSAANGTVGALTDSAALEVLSGSTITATGRNIGTSGFVNPLDLAGSTITLNSPGNGGTIGYAGAPVIANTQNLIVNAANVAGPFTTPTGSPFNVSTGATALKNLTVLANPTGVGAGGLAQVRTEAGQPNDRTYAFLSDGTNFTFNPGTVPATQFVNGTLSFASNSGSIVLGNAVLPATATLAVAAQSGSITGTPTLDGGAFVLQAGTNTTGAAVNVTVGDVGTTVRPTSLQITSGNSGGFTSRAGSIQTGNINAGTVTLTSFGGGITVGPTGTGTIGSAGTPAGAVTLLSNFNGSVSGAIQAGDVFADSVNFKTLENSVTTGNVNAATNIDLISRVAVTSGTLDSPAIKVHNDFIPGATAPVINTGAIGTVRPVKSLAMFGRTTTVNGGITGDAAAAIDVEALSGQLVVNGPIVAGDGSNIILLSNGALPYQFSAVNAGPTGSVRINSSNGIEQTADAAADGITAGTVSLSATNGAVTNSADAVNNRVDLHTAKNLTMNARGRIAIDAHGSTLDTLDITKHESVATSGIDVANLGGQTLTVSAAPSDLTLSLNSPTPLDFNFRYQAGGITLAAPGIVTSGGDVTLTSTAGIDGTNGGITTGGATGGGAVTLATSGGSLTTGAINTVTTGTGTSGRILANCGGCDIVVNGNLDAGAGTINLTTSGTGSVSRTGSSNIRSTTLVDVNTANANIGSAALPLLITAPTAILRAGNADAVGTVGTAFAALTGTGTLTLTGTDGFNVISDTALNTLTLTTKGGGTGTPGAGTLNLTALGQTYAFDRPTTDLFGNAITNTFQVISLAGATPPATATVRTSNGDLLVMGSASLTTPNLTLGGGNFAGDIKLQGNSATPLVLSQPTQTIRAPRDLLITGNVALSSSGAQTLFAQRNITAQAQSGSIAILGNTQNIETTSGSMTFTGGALADETVMLSASGSQHIHTTADNFIGGDAIFQAGAGDRANVSVVYTGPNSGIIQQQIEARGNVQVLGGAGANSDALITTATGDQLIRARGDILVRGGGGAGSDGRITNTGPGTQIVGESRLSGGIPPTDFPYPTRHITVQGGSGATALGEVTSTGPQRIYSKGGTLSVLGGVGAGAAAQISTASTADQHIGLPPELVFGNVMGSIVIRGGMGDGATAQITTPAFQRVRGSGTLTLAGGGDPTLPGSGNNAFALLQGAGQSIRADGGITLGGSNTGTNSFARIASSAAQTLSFGSLTMTGGLAANNPVVGGSFTKIDAAGTQTLSGGNMTLTGAGTGTPDTSRIANAGAVIEGQSQTIFAGNITMRGGAGRDPATVSDAVFRNTAGSQTVRGSNITLTGGHEHNTTGIINQGDGTQTVTAFGNILLQSDNVVPPAHSNAFVRIQNQPATQQTITASGTLTVDNSGLFAAPAGHGGPGESLVEITSAGTQTINARSVDVVTQNFISNGVFGFSTGNARISAVGNQWIHTTNGGIQVAAGGIGEASITTSATQLLEVDYPGMMQQAGVTGELNIGLVTQRFPGASDATPLPAAGNSKILATDQLIYAGSIVIQGPTRAGTSKLGATNTQNISTLSPLVGVQILGGGDPASFATIDPIEQTLILTGPSSLISDIGAATISATGPQTIYVTGAGLVVDGAFAPATISTTSPIQNVVAGSGVTLIGPFASIGSGALPAGASSAAVAGTAGTTEVLHTQEAMQETLTSTESAESLPEQRRQRGEMQCQ